MRGQIESEHDGVRGLSFARLLTAPDFSIGPLSIYVVSLGVFKISAELIAASMAYRDRGGGATEWSVRKCS
jgi:hypothetical protein